MDRSKRNLGVFRDDRFRPIAVMRVEIPDRHSRCTLRQRAPTPATAM